jgi:hypothetical protein
MFPSVIDIHYKNRQKTILPIVVIFLLLGDKYHKIIVKRMKNYATSTISQVFPCRVRIKGRSEEKCW